MVMLNRRVLYAAILIWVCPCKTTLPPMKFTCNDNSGVDCSQKPLYYLMVPLAQFPWQDWAHCKCTSTNNPNEKCTVGGSKNILGNYRSKCDATGNKRCDYVTSVRYACSTVESELKPQGKTYTLKLSETEWFWYPNNDFAYGPRASLSKRDEGPKYVMYEVGDKTRTGLCNRLQFKVRDEDGGNRDDDLTVWTTVEHPPPSAEKMGLWTTHYFNYTSTKPGCAEIPITFASEVAILYLKHPTVACRTTPLFNCDTNVVDIQKAVQELKKLKVTKWEVNQTYDLEGLSSFTSSYGDQLAKIRDGGTLIARLWNNDRTDGTWSFKL